MQLVPQYNADSTVVIKKNEIIRISLDIQCCDFVKERKTHHILTTTSSHHHHRHAARHLQNYYYQAPAIPALAAADTVAYAPLAKALNACIVAM